MNKKYDKCRKWDVNPKTFEATQLDAEMINAARNEKNKRSSAAKGGTLSFAE